MRYVSYMGELFHISERNYRKMLEDIVNNNRDSSLDRLGKSLGQVEDVTNFEASWAEQLLEGLIKK